jgi:hypothetical protein
MALRATVRWVTFPAMVDLLLHLWQSFLALHPWGYVIAGVLLLWGFIKRKAVGTATSAAWKKCSEWFWGWMGKKIVLPPPQAPPSTGRQLRTYKGIFQGYLQYENPPHHWFFTVSSNGITHKVPVWSTQLFSGIQYGQFIEVDTFAIGGWACEQVQRVRIAEGLRS